MVRMATLVGLLIGAATPAWPQEATTEAEDRTSYTRPGQEESRSVRVLRIEGGISVDGRLDEPAWRRAEVAANFVQSVPHPGEPASLPTEARVLLSDAAVYVGIHMYDPEPDSIVGQLARRGASNVSDWVYIAFDSHRDRRSAFQFGVNAAGVKRDMRITDDVREDDSWDAVWDVGVRRVADGWTAEFRIPLAQLRFSAREIESTWGFNVRRSVARTGEISSWAPVVPGSGSYVSSFGNVTGVEIDRPPRRIEILPYATTQLIREPGDAGNPYHRRTGLHGGTGTDLHVGLAPWLTLSATFNPDFGQVETDPSVINLSAFEVFLLERRPFFVEGAEHFRTPGANLFYSRRIGRTPQLGTPPDAAFADRPERTTILGAAKLTGRSPEGWSIGALQALTARERAQYTTASGEEAEIVVEPLTSYSMARVGRDFRAGRSAINLTVTATNRFLDDSPAQLALRRAAYTGGVDARHRFARNRFELSGNLYRSYVRGDPIAIARTQQAPGRYFGRPDAEHLTYQPDLTSLGGYNANLRFAKVAGGPWRVGLLGYMISPGFEVNDLGIQFGVDRMGHNAWIGYHQFASGNLFRRWSVQAIQNGIWTLGRERVDVNWTLDTNFELHNRWNLRLWGMRHLGGVDPNRLRGGPAYFNPGQWMGRVTVSTDRRRAVSADASMYGNLLDQDEGSQWSVSAGMLWRPFARADLQLRPFFVRRQNASQFVAQPAAGPEGKRRYVLAHIAQTTAALELRLNYTLTPDLSFEMHARPFVGAGAYDGFASVVPEAARQPDRNVRLAYYSPEQLRIVQTDGRRLIEVDEDQSGSADLTIPHPDFNTKQLRSTAVLRWEFRPGSTLFLVWSHDRSRFDRDGSFDLFRDGRRLAGAPGRTVVAVKATYWIGQ